MRRWTLLFVALAACGTGDDSFDGTRSFCAEGGALNDNCDDIARTPEAACWRMVDCGAMPVHHDERFRLDWNRCVEVIEEIGSPQDQLVIACIAASSCDQLKNDDLACFRLGAN